MAHELNFSGRTALVTGAASGIGAACARWLDGHGIEQLLLVDIDKDALEALDLQCETATYEGDVSDEGFWGAFETAHPAFDHAIVNAGIGAGGAIAELGLEEWRRVMNVNLDGAFLTLRTAMRAMEKAGGGSAVITGSSSGVKAIAGIGPYGVSKAAVAHMGRIAALEGAPKNIRVNTIAPGGVDTAIWDSSEDFRRSAETQGRDATIKAMAATTPRGQFASADEIAANIGYLLSDAAANVTGSVLVSDGGFTL